MDSTGGVTAKHLPYMDRQEEEKLSQTNKQVEELTDDIDKVEIFHFGSK